MTLYQNKRVTPVLILDEMHMASNGFLNDISIFINFGMDAQTPFVLILAGLPHLVDRMRLSHNQPLAQLIILRYQVGPLSPEEVRLYLKHLLQLPSLRDMAANVFDQSAKKLFPEIFLGVLICNLHRF